MSRRAVSCIFSVFGLGILGGGLTGCGTKIDCNGNQVKEDVITIVQENLKSAAWYKEMEPAISGEPSITEVKTLSKNDELKQAQCAAQYTFTYNSSERKVDVGYNLSYLQDKKEVQVLATADQVKTGVMQLAMSEAPIKNGTQKIYDEKTGKLVQSIEWKNNVKDGNQKMWTADGETLIADIKWIDGKSNGWEKHPDKSGKIITDLVWKEGKATGFQTTMYIDGSPSEYFTLKDGLRNGPHKQYGIGSPGQSDLVLEDSYKDDKLDGLQRKYYNGKVEQEIMYKDGQIVADSAATNSPAAAGAAANAGNATVDQCVDAKVEAFHKSEGMDALINNDVLQEWTAQCAKQ
jgi:antitoxin component YwqK of YwqJK toxin-antitoxin module